MFPKLLFRYKMREVSLLFKLVSSGSSRLLATPLLSSNIEDKQAQWSDTPEMNDGAAIPGQRNVKCNPHQRNGLQSGKE